MSIYKLLKSKKAKHIKTKVKNVKSKNSKKITQPKHKSFYKKSLKLESIKLTHSLLYNDVNIKHNIKNNIENNITYKSIFTNKKMIKDIIFLKKISFDIFYSCKYKYPLLVRELLTISTGKGENKIIRANFEDPWNFDNEIPLKSSLSLKDYDIFEYYGGSSGHNAPASWHKKSMEDYTETFLFTNITPQYKSLNSGIWLLLETMCKSLQYDNKLTNINIFTGSIPNSQFSLLYNAQLDKSIINIPIYMFKIICFNHVNYPNITFLGIFIFNNNNNYNIYNDKNKFNFTNLLLPIKSYKWFENKTNINIINLLKFYNMSTNNIKSFKNIINLTIYYNDKNHLKTYINYSYEIYKIINSKTLDELYKFYDIVNSKPIESIIYYLTTFYKTRNKLIRDNILYKKFTTFKNFDKFFIEFKNELYTKYVINKEIELDIIEESQDGYLNTYYNIVKKKLQN